MSAFLKACASQGCQRIALIGGRCIPCHDKAETERACDERAELLWVTRTVAKFALPKPGQDSDLRRAILHARLTLDMIGAKS